MPLRSRKKCYSHIYKLNTMKANVRAANDKTNLLLNLNELAIYKSIITGNQFNISCLIQKDVSEDLNSWMMNLLENNMAEFYKSCDWGWDVTAKLKEMSDEKSRFLIAYLDCKNPVAFVHFRFDMDHDISVIYCYEIQLDVTARKQGLAKHLLNILDSLRFQYTMEKVILTVFKHNTIALNFFLRQGFKLDETSPENYSVDTFYSILSKREAK